MQPGPIVEWVSHHLDDDAEAVFLGGNGFLAAVAVERLERHTGRLVLAANQVLLWSILSNTRSTLRIEGCGQLLREGLPASDPLRGF